MLLYDITSVENAFDTIYHLTGVSIQNINQFISQSIITDEFCLDGTNLTGANFIDKFNISSDIHDTLLICALHYTSNNDNSCAIKKYGLRDLKFSLTEDTPLKLFLADNGFNFDIINHTMYYNGRSYNIFYERQVSIVDNPLQGIARKIFYDNGLSCFLYLKDITRYLGNVHKRPEILYNIDQFAPKLNLSYKWMKQCKSYEIKFMTSFNQFEKYTFMDDDRSTLEALLDKALCVAGNMVCGEAFGYLKPLSIVEPEQILQYKELS